MSKSESYDSDDLEALITEVSREFSEDSDELEADSPDTNLRPNPISTDVIRCFTHLELLSGGAKADEEAVATTWESVRHAVDEALEGRVEGNVLLKLCGSALSSRGECLSEFVALAIFTLANISGKAEFLEVTNYVFTVLIAATERLSERNGFQSFWLHRFPSDGIYPMTETEAKSLISMEGRSHELRNSQLMRRTGMAIGGDEFVMRPVERRNVICRVVLDLIIPSIREIMEEVGITGTGGINDLLEETSRRFMNEFTDTPFTLRRPSVFTMLAISPDYQNTKTRSGVESMTKNTRTLAEARFRNEKRAAGLIRKEVKRRLKKAAAVDATQTALERARRLVVRGAEQSAFEKFLRDDVNVINQISSSQAQTMDTSLGAFNPKRAARKAARAERLASKKSAGYLK